MNNLKMKVPAVLLFLMLSVVLAMAATVSGTVTDTMCKAKHMIPGKTPAECARECVKQGAQWALVSGGKTYMLTGDAAKISAVAGKKVTVSGDLKGTTLAVKSITEAK